MTDGGQHRGIAGAAGGAAAGGSGRTPFGWEVVVDLDGCDPGVINSQSRLAVMVVHLCDGVLGMRLVGEPLIEW